MFYPFSFISLSLFFLFFFFFLFFSILASVMRDIAASLFALPSDFATVFPTTAFLVRVSLSRISRRERVLYSDNCPREYTRGNSSLNQHRRRRSLKRHSSYARFTLICSPLRFTSVAFSCEQQRPLLRANSSCLSGTRFSWELRHPPQENPPGSVRPSKEDLPQSSN